MTFVVTASSIEEAVDKANAALEETAEGDSIYVPRPVHHAYVNIGDELRVEKSMIVEETPVTEVLPRRAFYYLIEHDYEYSSGQDIEDLLHDDEPSFIKAIQTADSIYGLLNVRPRYSKNIEQWSFHFDAVLYPIKRARMIDGQGGAQYRVKIEDGQLFTTLDELPRTLEIYEQKFMDLIYALRKADPVDGLPLEEDERRGE